MKPLLNWLRGFAGGPDLSRQQTHRFLLEDLQVQVRLPYSNVETEEPPRVVNFPFKTKGWFESHMKQLRQHYYVPIHTECWYYMAPVLRFADGELGHVFCSFWLKKVPDCINALDRRRLAEYVITEHDQHYNAAVQPEIPYNHGKGLNTKIRQDTRTDAELAASRGSTYTLDNLDKFIEIAINSHGYPPLAPASIISLHGQDWVFYQDKHFSESPSGADFYCLPLDNRYYFAIGFQYTVCQSGKKRWLKHAKATQQMILDSLIVSPVDVAADNLLVHTSDQTE